MQRIWIGLGALAGFGTIVMATVAAHGVTDPTAARVVGSGVQMQLPTATLQSPLKNG